MPRRSATATASAVVAIAALAAALLGPLAVQLGVASPFSGFRIFLLVVPGTVIALVLGAIGLLRTRPGSGRNGRQRAWVGTGIGVVLFLFLGVVAGSGRGVPAIHDITTNIDDPPVFSDAVRNAAGRINGVDYPDGGDEVSRQQREHYPDVKPIQLPVPPDQALARARRAAGELGWTVTRVDESARVLEAYDVTLVFQFIDDVVVRVRPLGTGSVVDVRSNSRVGGSDIGANAARIRAFRDALLAEAD